MPRALLISVLLVGLAIMGLSSGTMAYFSDVESSTGHITVGTIDLQLGHPSGAVEVTTNLHPNIAYDWSNYPDNQYPSPPIPSGKYLTDAELDMLENSDDVKYVSYGPWSYWHFSEDNVEYIDFWFENLPDNVEILDVKLKFEWTRASYSINAFKIFVYDETTGATWYQFVYTHPDNLPPLDTDRLYIFDLPSIDTVAEVNSTAVRFKAQCPDSRTWHDWVKLEVTYRTGDGGIEWRDGISETWVIEDMKPCHTADAEIYIRNVGANAGDHIEIHATNTVEDPEGPESDTEENTTDLDRAIEITEMTWGGDNILPLLPDANGNGYKDLDDLEQAGMDNIRPVPLPNAANYIRFYIALHFHGTGDDDYQGDRLITTLVFILNQDPSQ